jgi:hypothetical protein
MITLLFYGYVLGYWGTGEYTGMYTGVYTRDTRYDNLTLSDYIHTMKEGAILHYPGSLRTSHKDLLFDQWVSPSRIRLHYSYEWEYDVDAVFYTDLPIQFDPVLLDGLREIAEDITRELDDPVFMLTGQSPEWHLIRRGCVIDYKETGDVVICETFEDRTLVY